MFRRLRLALQKRLFQLRYSGLGCKQRHELWWWSESVKRYVRWYRGEKFEDLGAPLGPPPSDGVKETAHSIEENAIRTLYKLHYDRYLKHLLLPREHFQGKTLLDIGCGPFPFALVFTGCEVYGLDQLIGRYTKLGFPMKSWSKRIHYIQGDAEKMPIDDNCFDAVVSVNALDHTDDFAAVAREVTRVLRPDGILRFEIHYHTPTQTEPWELNDEIIATNYGHLGVRKICERPFVEVVGKARPGLLALWSNERK